jgi:hypothetical protein
LLYFDEKLRDTHIITRISLDYALRTHLLSCYAHRISTPSDVAISTRACAVGSRFRAFLFRRGYRCCASTDRLNGIRFAPFSGCSSWAHRVSLAISSIIAFAILRNYDCLTDAFRIAFANCATLLYTLHLLPATLRLADSFRVSDGYNSLSEFL